MQDDASPTAAPDLAPAARAPACLAVGAGAGAVLAASDVVRMALSMGLEPRATHLVTTLLWYVGLGALAGWLLGALFPVRDGRGRAVDLLVFGVGFCGIAGHLGLVFFGFRAAPGLWGVVGGAVVASAVAVLLVRRLGLRLFRPRLAAALALAVVAVGGAIEWSRSPDGAPPAAPRALRDAHPSILLLLVDTLRADHLSLHGYERPTSPHLDEFAASSLVFEQARSTASWTKPSMSSLLTGLPAGESGGEEKYAPVPGVVVTLPEVLAAAGYGTALFADNPFVSASFGLTQGVEHRDEVPVRTRTAHLGISDTSLLSHALWLLVPGFQESVGRTNGRPRGAPYLNRAFLDWLDAQPADRPWFAHLHYMEPHEPYDPPAAWREKMDPTSKTGVTGAPRPHGVVPFEAGADVHPSVRRELIASYDGSIAWWDHQFGLLLDELRARGALENTIVVITSDHGEGLGDHGTWDHRNSLHDELLRVPLVVHGPGVPVARVPHVVSTEGLAETLLRTAGWLPPETMLRSHEHHLLPLPETDRTVRSRVRFWSGGRAASVLAGGLKWIRSEKDGKVVLSCFDVRNDPGELHDLATERADETPAIHDLFARWDEHLERVRHEPGQHDVSDGMRESLEALGYIGGDGE